MWRRFSVLSTAMPLLGLTMMIDVVPAADTSEVQQLREDIRVLEERLDKLERTEALKTTIEYVCPDGEILEQLPPSGRCPDGSRPRVRETVRKTLVARRQSIAEQIEAAFEDAQTKKVGVGGQVRGILQQVLNGGDGQNKLYGVGAVDLTLIYQPMVRTTLFVDLEAIGGPGPDHELESLSRVNADAETLGDQDEKLTLREAWLGLQLIGDRLDVFVGKLDLTNYFDRNSFANDETTQFLNAALVNNPMLKQPPNRAGVVARWDTNRDLSFGLGVQASSDLDEDLLDEPFAVGEIDYHSALFIDGHYRLWARVSTFPENHSRVTWGVGISLDQLLLPWLGVFVRAGFSQIEGVSRTSYAVSTGVWMHSPLVSRPKDRLGVGYSFQREAAGHEHLGEAYYNLFLTDHLAIIGNIEWLFSGPNQVTGETNRNVMIPGVRAVVGF